MQCHFSSRFPDTDDVGLWSEDTDGDDHRLALRTRAEGQAPIDALRMRIRELNYQKHPICYVSSLIVGWWQHVRASGLLKARLRELADEATELLAIELAGPNPSGFSRLTAGIIVLTLYTARDEAVRQFESGTSAKKANATFLALTERKSSAVEHLPKP